MFSLKVFTVLGALLIGAQATTITTDKSVAANKSFDYVVAGAGLSAIVVGTKLSAQGYSVLLIEAGKDLQNHAPIYNAERRGELQNDKSTNCNWDYVASAVDGTPLAATIDSGKCIGGSTSINGMVWYRPTKAELDAIESLGNPGWNSAALFPYMDAIEHNIPPSVSQRLEGANYVKSVHGFNGAVNTSFPVPMRIPTAQRIYKAAIAAVFGVTTSPDLSDRTGAVSASTSWTIWWDPVAQITRRASAAYSLLYPAAKQQKKLTILAEHKVAKVIFDKNLGATGLQFGPAAGGSLYTVSAKYEVILAAGSLGTPPILERSGVGAKSILKSFGINQLVDLPGVGLNLQDQPGTGLSALVDSLNVTNTLLIDNRNLFAPVITLLSMDQLFGATQSAAYAKSLKANIDARAKAVVASGADANVQGAKELLNVVVGLMTDKKQPVTELISESYPSVMTSVFWPLTPLSRGYVHINSSNPFVNPRITPRLLSDDFDVDVAIQVAKKARALYQSSPFASLISQVAIDAVGLDATDAEWEAWLKSSSFGASHWLGSAAMRPRASGGVVDTNLAVYGTSNLRVVDASIIPFQITSHTMSMMYAVSQKAADIILSCRR
ncbi:Alcohol oxidase [Mycena kentingensis (nom. inval.)]|nr:Alcohol oxidase [Mycena kentingensis (nom. inval.)]